MTQITITAQFPRKRLSEGSQAAFTANFYNDSFVLASPSSAKYRIDNPETGEAITDWTSLTPATSIAINANGSTQLLRDQCESEEKRRITVMANAGLTSQAVKAYDWLITNQMGVS